MTKPRPTYSEAARIEAERLVNAHIYTENMKNPMHANDGIALALDSFAQAARGAAVEEAAKVAKALRRVLKEHGDGPCNQHIEPNGECGTMTCDGWLIDLAHAIEEAQRALDARGGGL